MTALPGIAGLFLQLVQPVTGYLSGSCLILQNSHSPLYFTFRKCLKIFSYDGLKGPICNEQTVNNCVGPCAFAHSSKQYLMNSALRKLSMLSRFKYNYSLQLKYYIPVPIKLLVCLWLIKVLCYTQVLTAA